MELGLKGKVVVITGGSTGIGAATAIAFAREGCKVAICARTKANVDKLVDYAETNDLSIWGMSADVSDDKQLQNFIDSSADKYGGINILFNNAGIGCNTYSMDLTREEWDRVIAVNLTAVWMGCKFAVPYIKASGGGSIVSTSSLAARMMTTRRSVYAITKAGVSTYTTLLASELSADNIRVNAIAPGVIMSEMLKEAIKRPDYSADFISKTAMMQRIGEPEEAANAVLFLCSDLASYITGETLDVSGGKFRVQDPWSSWDKARTDKK